LAGLGGDVRQVPPPRLAGDLLVGELVVRGGRGRGLGLRRGFELRPGGGCGVELGPGRGHGRRVRRELGLRRGRRRNGLGGRGRGRRRGVPRHRVGYVLRSISRGIGLGVRHGRRGRRRRGDGERRRRGRDV